MISCSNHRFKAGKDFYGRAIEQAFVDVTVWRGEPMVSYTMELTRFNNGDIEVYFSSEHHPTPMFIGYAHQLAGSLWGRQFDEARYEHTWTEEGGCKR